MARIAGVDIPREKRLEISLTYIFGVGRTLAQQVCDATEMSRDTRVRDLTGKDKRLDARARQRRDLGCNLGCNLGCKNTIQSRSGVDVRNDNLPNVLVSAHSENCQLLCFAHECLIPRNLPARGSSPKCKLVV